MAETWRDMLACVSWRLKQLLFRNGAGCTEHLLSGLAVTCGWFSWGGLQDVLVGKKPHRTVPIVCYLFKTRECCCVCIFSLFEKKKLAEYLPSMTKALGSTPAPQNKTWWINRKLAMISYRKWQCWTALLSMLDCSLQSFGAGTMLIFCPHTS